MLEDFIAINDIGWDAGLGIVLWHCKQSSNALRIKRTIKFSCLLNRSLRELFISRRSVQCVVSYFRYSEEENGSN